MKIIKPKPICKGCGHWKVLAHCETSMVNGCNSNWCVMCWPSHAATHDAEWDKLTDSEKDKLIERSRQ